MSNPSITFVFDVGVGKRVEEFAQQKSYRVICIRDIDHSMADIDILRLAVAEKGLVVTMDKDFGEMVFHSGLPHNGVLLLRLDDAPSRVKVNVFEQILDQFADQLSGKFCVFKNGKLRIRDK